MLGFIPPPSDKKKKKDKDELGEEMDQEVSIEIHVLCDSALFCISLFTLFLNM